MRHSIAIISLLLAPFAASAGEWFIGVGGWGVSCITGAWTLRLGSLADIPFSPQRVGWAVALVSVTSLLVWFYVRHQKRKQVA